MDSKKKILVYGAGSIGVYLGTMLFSRGFDVTLLGRRKLKKLHENILINDKLYQIPPRAYKLKADSFYDIIFVTTKLYDSLRAMKHLKSQDVQFGIIAFIQNGLVHEKFYGDYKKHSGFATVSIFEGYRLIENQLLATKSSMGWQTENTQAGKSICGVLQDAKIQCVPSPELDAIRVEKMMLVNAVGPLSAIEKKTLGEIISNQKTREIVDELFEESYLVFKDEHKLPPLTILKKRFYKTISQVKTHYSSMYQDLASGRPTEIEYLCGLIMHLGEKRGIKTPANKKIYLKIKSMEKKGKKI